MSVAPLLAALLGVACAAVGLAVRGRGFALASGAPSVFGVWLPLAQVMSW